MGVCKKEKQGAFKVRIFREDPEMDPRAEGALWTDFISVIISLFVHWSHLLFHKDSNCVTYSSLRNLTERASIGLDIWIFRWIDTQMNLSFIVFLSDLSFMSIFSFWLDRSHLRAKTVSIFLQILSKGGLLFQISVHNSCRMLSCEPEKVKER